MSQTAFGDSCGVSKGSQINYETDKRFPDGEYLMHAAKLGADILFIVTGERSSASLPPMMLQSMSRTLAEPSEFAPIPVYSAELAAGAGSTNDSDEVIDHLAFRRDWLKRMRVSPSAAVIARTWGDSMLPTLHHGDVILIDRAKSEPPSKVRSPQDKRPAPIYALLDEGHARVKRIELAAPGLLVILSDNPVAGPEFRAIGDVTIIGEVVWWGHANR